MKKLIYLFILGIGFTSCSVESLDSTENLLTADAKAKMQMVSPVIIAAPPGVLCAGDIHIFNVDVTTGSNFQVQQMIEGVWEQVHLANQGQTGTKSFEVVLVVGENRFRHTNQGTGSNWTEYATIFTGIDCNTCENLLTAELTCGEIRTASFTFTAFEAGPIVIQGGLTNGTTIKSANSNVLTRNLTHNGVVNSNANVTRWEGNVEACQEVTVTVEFTGGNGIGDWSAKRKIESGEELILGSTEAIECN